MRVEVERSLVLIDELAWPHDGEVIITVDGIERFAIVFEGDRTHQSILQFDGTVAHTITTINEED